MRLGIDRDGLRMFAHRPLIGWGLGTFPIVYPEFRSFSTTFFVNEAHNDYIQLLVETGAVGLALMLWFLVRFYRNAARKLRTWETSVNGAIALAAVLGCTGILDSQLPRFQSANSRQCIPLLHLGSIGSSQTDP